MQEDQHGALPPDWAFDLHGHPCPFMPLGFRMGQAALAEPGVGREPHHTLHVIAELGEGHPQTCLMDRIQIATGATFGKTLIEKTRWANWRRLSGIRARRPCVSPRRRNSLTVWGRKSSSPTAIAASNRLRFRPRLPRRRWTGP